MGQQFINNGDTGLQVRTKLNENFTELYTGKDSVTVNTFADLPAPNTVALQKYWVLTSTGVFLVNRKSRGCYYSDGAAWIYLGDFPTTADQVGNVPAGGIAATDIQGAINELDGEKLGTAHAGSGGAAHSNAVASGSAGFMTGADKAKLDGIAAGATANSSDATLLARANHTGTQAIATVLAATTARFFGRITAAGGPGEELTGTQATTLLDEFTSVLKGLVPASGGGTANFLRADGTWAAPSAGSGSPGGTSGQMQYNASGAFGGAANVTVDNGDLVIAANAAPVPPGANLVKFFGRKLANRIMPAFVGPTGLDTTLQPHMTRNKVARWNPPGNATTVPAVDGVSAVTAVGTATARNVATTNRLTRMRRLGYVSAATAGALAGFTCAAVQWTIGNGSGEGGFHLIIRFGCSDAATVAGARQFVGMVNNTTAPTNVEPSTLTNCIGVGHGAADSNLRIFYGGSAAQTSIDLGANFPANTLWVDGYELSLFASPANQDVGYRVENLRTGSIAEGTLTNTTPGTTLPLNTAFLGPRAWRTNNATALAVGIDIVAWYIETDY